MQQVSAAPVDQDGVPRVLASITDYAQLVDACRARAAERKIAITGADVAQVSGLPSHYVAKLLSVRPVKRIGLISLGPLLGVLGVKLVMVEDPIAMAKYTDKLPKRNESCVHNGAAITINSAARICRK